MDSTSRDGATSRWKSNNCFFCGVIEISAFGRKVNPDRMVAVCTLESGVR